MPTSETQPLLPGLPNHGIQNEVAAFLVATFLRHLGRRVRQCWNPASAEELEENAEDALRALAGQ
jgi:hypothetical protein